MKIDNFSCTRSSARAQKIEILCSDILKNGIIYSLGVDPGGVDCSFTVSFDLSVFFLWKWFMGVFCPKKSWTVPFIDISLDFLGNHSFSNSLIIVLCISQTKILAQTRNQFEVDRWLFPAKTGFHRGTWNLSEWLIDYAVIFCVQVVLFFHVGNYLPFLLHNVEGQNSKSSTIIPLWM